MDYKILKLRSIIGILLIAIFISIIIFKENILKYLIFLAYILIILEVYKNFKRNNFYFFIYIYLITSFLFIDVFIIYYYNKLFFLMFISIIISFDTGSYIMGSLFGQKKIFPSISPNKTIEGFIFGSIFAFLIALLINFFLNLFSFGNLLLFSSLLILSAFIGDILQSIFKRKSNLDNSSNLLPGHGGFFDRFDSIIFSSYLLLLYNLFQ